MASMITTVDNPFSPLTQFDEWYAYDIHKGYGTCAYLARIAKTSPSLTPYQNEVEIDRAIDEIIRLHGGEIYKKIIINDEKYKEPSLNQNNEK